MRKRQTKRRDNGGTRERWEETGDKAAYFDVDHNKFLAQSSDLLGLGKFGTESWCRMMR